MLNNGKCINSEMNQSDKDEEERPMCEGEVRGEITPSAPPDLIQNLLTDEEKEKNYNKSVYIKDVNETANGHLNSFGGPDQDYCNNCNGYEERKPSLPYPVRSANIGVAVPETKHDKRVRKRKRFMRAMAWIGWIFCCPVMAVGMMAREHPDDDENGWKDDPCLPCF